MRIGICDLNLINYSGYRGFGRPSKYAALIEGHFLSRPKLKCTVELISNLEEIPSYHQVYVINDRPNLYYNYQLFDNSCLFVGDYWPKMIQYYSSDWDYATPSIKLYSEFFNNFFRRYAVKKNNIYEFQPFLIKTLNGYNAPTGENVLIMDDRISNDLSFIQTIQESEVKRMALAYPIELDLQNDEYLEEFLSFIGRFPLRSQNEIFIKSESISSLNDLDRFFYLYNSRKMKNAQEKVIFYYYTSLDIDDKQSWVDELKKFLYIRDFTLRYCDVTLVFKAKFPQHSFSQEFLKTFEHWDYTNCKYSFIEYLYIKACGSKDPGMKMLMTLLSGAHNYRLIKTNKENFYIRALEFFYNHLYSYDEELTRMLFTCSYQGGRLKLD